MNSPLYLSLLPMIVTLYLVCFILLTLLEISSIISVLKHNADAIAQIVNSHYI
jgi:hypothetical protein